MDIEKNIQIIKKMIKKVRIGLSNFNKKRFIEEIKGGLGKQIFENIKKRD